MQTFPFGQNTQLGFQNISNQTITLQASLEDSFLDNLTSQAQRPKKTITVGSPTSAH